MKPPIHLETRKQNGARLYSPTAARNKGPIGDILKEHMSQGAKVLEIASGSGEHALHFCSLRPDITWQPSDPDAESRLSQNDWARDGAGQMLPSLPLNTRDEHWWTGLESIDNIYCGNMIHIAPWDAAIGLADGAKRLLKSGSYLFLYGPFLEGQATAPSNLKFDENLKARNPKWGVRKLSDVKHMFSEQGFNLEARIVMPKENRLLIFIN